MPKKVYGSEYFEQPYKESMWMEFVEIVSADDAGNPNIMTKAYPKASLNPPEETE